MPQTAQSLSDWDTPETATLLTAFAQAWQDCLADYAQRRLNTEHCLQAALYHHLRAHLPEDWRVFSEAVVQLGDSGRADTGKSKVVVDLLIENARRVIGAIELKFTPRGIPSRESMRKDLTSLAHITTRRATADRATLDCPRFRNQDDDGLPLRVLPQRKLIFAAIVSDEAPDVDRDGFWQATRPNTGYWAERTSLPANFGVALGKATASGGIVEELYGPPFARAGLQTPPSDGGTSAALGQ